MVKVSIRGQMERRMTEHGLKEDSMVKEDLLILKERVNLATGRMAKGKNGLKEVALVLIIPIKNHRN